MFRTILIAAGLVCLPFSAATADTAPSLEVVSADAENWRAVDPENLILFETTVGDVVIEIFPEVAPAHATQFRAIVRSGDFDGTSFHRVIDDFMAQGGDVFALHGRESGLPDIPGEFTFRRDPAEMLLDPIGEADTARAGYMKGFPILTQAAWLADMSKDGLVQSYIPHCPGVVSTARTDDPNSANSQFFLMRGRAEHLDRQYTAWGRIIAGADLVYDIKTGEPPANPDILQRARMAADLPEDETLQAWVQRTDGPDFTATLADLAPTGDEDVCALPAVPALVVR
ncbi:MAG: peptidylprolyl isomerase [Hyphomonadaceae bacterium]|nr:peptidylprolyl isomerase [Hyphomonadaceae bacterium]